MIYVLLAILLSAIAYYFVFNGHNRQRNTNVLCAIFMFAIAAAKSIELSPVDDLINYKNMFIRSFLYPFHIISLFFNKNFSFFNF